MVDEIHAIELNRVNPIIEINPTTISFEVQPMPEVTIELPNRGARGVQGEKGDQGIQGEKGDTGAQGAKGDTGEAGEITVGTTTTLPAGSPATVVNSGSSTNAVFDFGIPKGVDGAGGTWGSITGDINTQTDLQNQLSNKVNIVPSAISGDIPVFTTQGGIADTGIKLIDTISTTNNIYSASKVDSLINNLPAPSSSSYTMLSGNVDSLGNADILGFSGTTLNFKVGGSYPSLALAYADKSQETLTALASITGLSTNGAYTIVKEKGQNPVALLSTKVTQGKIFPVSPTNGDYHCLTATGLQTYKRVSGAWVEAQYVPLGTATVTGSVITAVSTKSFNQNGYDVNVFSDAIKYINNLAQRGYTKLPNGLIIQWDSYSVSGSNTWTYPIAFPNACLFVCPVGSYNGGTYDITVTSMGLASSSCYIQVASYMKFFAIGY